jgi:membrane protein
MKRDELETIEARAGIPARAGVAREILSLMKKTVLAWLDDYAPSMGAALAYYTMFSIAPLLLIVITIAGWVFGAEAARGEIVEQLSGLMGEDGAKAAEGMLAAVGKSSGGIWATLFGIFLLIFGATTVLAELQSNLDRIWKMPEKEKSSGLWGFLRARLLSFGLILGIAFLLMVSLLVSAGIAAIGRWYEVYLGNYELVLQGLDFVVSFFLFTTLFATIYKFMPQARVAWSDVWIGAAFTTVLFIVGKTLIGLYIGKSGIASGFGAAASIVVMLIWVYYSAQIFLLGAEFTHAYWEEIGSGRRQSKSKVESRRAEGHPAPRKFSH